MKVSPSGLLSNVGRDYIRRKVVDREPAWSGALLIAAPGEQENRRSGETLVVVEFEEQLLLGKRSSLQRLMRLLLFS